MSNPEHGTAEAELPKELQPTQGQLQRLHAAILKHEVTFEPFDGLPSEASLAKFGSKLSDFEVLADPPLCTETFTPAQILRAPDKRVLWLSVFRNPDTNAVSSQTVLIIDPPANLSTRDELPTEHYRITEVIPGEYAIEHTDSPAMAGIEVEALQRLIDTSKPFDLFG